MSVIGDTGQFIQDVGRRFRLLQSRDICTKSNMCMKQEKGLVHMPGKEWTDKYAQVKSGFAVLWI